MFLTHGLVVDLRLRQALLKHRIERKTVFFSSLIRNLFSRVPRASSKDKRYTIRKFSTGLVRK